MHEIEQWLKNGKAWEAGLVLLDKYGTIRSVYATLRKMGASKPTKEKLEQQLRKELKKLKNPEDAKALPAAPVIKPVDLSKVEELTAQANKHYATMGALQARVLATADQSGRRKLYRDFLDAQFEFANAAFDRDYFEEHGVLPEPVKKKISVVKSLPGSLYAELIGLRSKVTRAEREQIPLYKTKTGDRWAKKLAEREADVVKWKIRITQLEQLPNG